MQQLSGQTIWIIGASSGIGAQLAIDLSKQGCQLIISARREEALQSVLSQMAPGNHRVLAFDVADAMQTVQAFSSIKHLDRVIFMAAIYDPSKKGRTDIHMIQKSLRVNLEGVFNMLTLVRPFFEQQRSGQIVLCGSVAGYIGLPNSQPYSATKAAIMNLAESLYTECKPKGVDVKLISPGFVRTPLTDKNHFDMPMMIEVEEASEAIVKGLTSKPFEIHFPKKFTYLLKLIRLLPYWLMFNINKRML